MCVLSCQTFFCPFFCRTHCNSQVLSQKQLCDERLAVAKLEYEKKLLKPANTLVRCSALLHCRNRGKGSENQTLSTFESAGVLLRSCTPPPLSFLFQENTPGAATKEEGQGPVKISTAASTTTNRSEPQVKEAAEILTNDIIVGKGEDLKGLWSL